MQAETARKSLSAFAIIIAGVALLGWLLDLSALKSVLPGLTTMKANTALGIVAAAIGVSFVGSRHRAVSIVAGTVTASLGLAVLVEYGAGVSLGIDELIFADPNTTSPPYPGRMAPATALGLSAMGLAVLLLERATGQADGRTGKSAQWAHLFALVPACVGYLSVAGYVYDVDGLYSFGPFASVALHTAIAFGLLAYAILLTLPAQGWSRKFERYPTARRVFLHLLPVAIGVPFLAGGVVVWGARRHVYDPLYGPALFAVVIASSTVWLAMYSAASVRAAEARLYSASAALRASEERLQLFVDRAPAAIAMFDTNMTYLAASRRYLRDYGLEAIAEADTLIGRSHDDILPEIPDRWREIHRRVMAGETVSADDDPFPRADGRTDWVRWEMTPWHGEDGRVGGALLFSELMTARKEAAAVLAESEARLRVSQEAAHVGTWDWDVATGVVHWSAEQYRLYGLDPDPAGIVGFDLWRRAVHPEDQERAQAEVMAAVHGDAPYDAQYRIYLPDAGLRWIYACGEVMRDDAGAPIRMLGVNLDITARIEAEAAIRATEARLRETLARSRDDLEVLVTERTRDLREAQERLSHVRRMEALGQLAGGIAHDFNNVLQSVQSGAALLERRADDPDGVRRLSRMVSDAAARGNAITKRLLAFARRGDLKAEPVDAGALLADMKNILSHTLGAGIRVSTEFGADLPRLLADKAQLETVLINLATNARDAMPSGGLLTLAAGAEAFDGHSASGHPATLQPGDYIRLRVADTGDGMDAPTLAKASEPFFTTKPSGTGLGLAMARGFAEQSGGGLYVQSRVGEGTEICLWFPATRSPLDPAISRPTQSQTTGQPRARILLVDDETYVRELLAEELALIGYAVVPAGSAHAALALLDAGEPVDLLISDLSMPGTDGLTLVHEAQRRRPKLPAILLTGFASNEAELAVGGALDGSFSLIRKPVDGQHLAERVAMLLAPVSDADRPSSHAGGGQSVG